MFKKTLLVLLFIASPALANEPSNYKEKIKKELVSSLKDPDSLKDLYIGAIVKDDTPNEFLDSQAKDRWVACVKYNAKNSYGAYGGRNTHLFYFSNNEVLGGIKEDELVKLGVNNPSQYCQA